MKNNNSIYFLFLISMSGLTAAMVPHSNSLPTISCQIFQCNQEFQHLDDLESHLRDIHSMATSTLCVDLGEELVGLLKRPSPEDSYASELDMSEPNEDSENLPFRCTIKNCNKTYAAIQYLRRHLISHSQERPFECKECGKGFKFIAHLRGHARVHENNYPHACERCESEFKRMSDLNKHIRGVHTLKSKHYKRKLTPRSLAQ